VVGRLREGVGEGVRRWFDENSRRVVGDGTNTLFWYDNWAGGIPLRLKFPRLFDLVVNKDCSVAEMSRLGWMENGRGWVWRRRLLAWEEDTVRECYLLVHNVVLQENVSDTWRWLLDPVHGYTVREAYRYITSNGVHVDRSTVDDVWHKLIPSKVSLFVWRLLRNRLPTKDNLVRRRVLQISESACVSGCGVTETASHLFLGCHILGSLWYHIWQWLGISTVCSGDL
jgi:hypothetical protein